MRGKKPTKKKAILRIEDLSAAAREFGISINKPAYYADNPGAGLPGSMGGSAPQKRRRNSTAKGSKRKKR